MARECSDHSACCDSRSFSSNCLTGPSGPERSKARRNQSCASCFSLVEAFFKDQGVSADQHVRIVAAFGDRRVDEIAQAALTRGLCEMGGLNQRRGAEFGRVFDESREGLGKRLPIAGFERNGNFEIEVAPRSGAAEFGGRSNRLFDAAAVKELPCVVPLYSGIAPLDRRVGFDDPHEIVVVPGVGVGLGSRRDVVADCR